MYCDCILKLRECHHTNQSSWQGSLFWEWEDTDNKCSFWSVPWYRYYSPLPFSSYLIGWFISECTYVGSLVLYPKPVEWEVWISAPRRPRSAVKSQGDLDRLASCLVLPKIVPILALTFPHPGELLSSRQKETVGHPTLALGISSLWPSRCVGFRWILSFRKLRGFKDWEGSLWFCC